MHVGVVTIADWATAASQSFAFVDTGIVLLSGSAAITAAALPATFIRAGATVGHYSRAIALTGAGVRPTFAMSGAGI